MTVGVVSLRRPGGLGLIVASLLLLAGTAPVAARTVADRHVPKVVIVVGPAGSATAYYRTLAEETATAAEKLTSNVVRVYSPDATWERVKAALQGASVVVYLGHGNGWPSVYHDALFPATEDGFGLNPQAGAADAHQYFGEARIAAEIHLAPNAVVVFSHLCYASGLSEPGLPEGTLDQAQQRVDNYAAGFMKAGAGAIIADAYLSPTYYVTSVLRSRRPVDAIWRAAPNRNDHFLTFPSARTKGAIAWMDPATNASGFERSLVARPNLTSGQVVGGASRRPPDIDPEPEPSLIGLGLTFGPPDLSATPTAGSRRRLLLPIPRDVARSLPAGLLIATRWDRLDAADPASAANVTQPPAPTPSTAPRRGSPATPAPTDPPTTAFVPDLVVPEVPGDVVAPVAAKALSTGLAVAVRVPTTPGLYRLVATLHQPDGLAFDAASQALVPALIVRVIEPVSAAYRVIGAATVTVGHPLALSVDVANLGTSAWGYAPDGRSAGPPEVILGARATLVAKWVRLGAVDGPAAPDSAATGLPPGLGAGRTATVSLHLTAPRAAGQYLVVIDLLDPDGTSFTVRGVAPAIVRVTVGS